MRFVFEKRCEITLFISYGQIFEQKFTKITHFLSFCQLRISFCLSFRGKVTKNQRENKTIMED